MYTNVKNVNCQSLDEKGLTQSVLFVDIAEESYFTSIHILKEVKNKTFAIFSLLLDNVLQFGSGLFGLLPIFPRKEDFK